MTTKKNGTKGAAGDIEAMPLMQLCDEALECERQIKLLRDRQAKLEKQLKAVAKGDKESRVPTDGGGFSLQYSCSDGSFVRITKHGDTLRSFLSDDADDLSVARDLAAGAFPNLFKTVVYYQLMPNFRAEAERLVPEHSSKLIDLVSVVGKTTVTYQAAKKVEEGS